MQGQAVTHKSFGRGTIVSLEEGVVTVCFTAGEKKFIYPDVFDEHLRLEDAGARKRALAKLEERRREEERYRGRLQAEQERLQRLQNFTLRADSHAVFHVPPECAGQVQAACAVSTGRYLTGPSRGKPRVALRLRPNSLCLLTQLPTGKPEGFREIMGAFMVREDFLGEDSHTGTVEGHPQYRMFLPVGDRLPFWEQFDREPPARWGSAAFRYCTGTVMNRILARLAERPAGPEAQGEALEFYRYFCKINRLPPLIETRPAPEGQRAEP